MKVGVKFPSTKAKTTRRSKYEFLLDGRVWLIEQDDFPRPFESVRMGVFMIAKSRGIKIRTRYVPDKGLYVQALKPPRQPRPGPDRARSTQRVRDVAATVDDKE